ncbi:hypothetical protein BaRGS_00017359, partial [Batillaria attramentaria]
QKEKPGPPVEVNPGSCVDTGSILLRAVGTCWSGGPHKYPASRIALNAQLFSASGPPLELDNIVWQDPSGCHWTPTANLDVTADQALPITNSKQTGREGLLLC